jgi:hypothetical protein
LQKTAVDNSGASITLALAVVPESAMFEDDEESFEDDDFVDSD